MSHKYEKTLQRLFAHPIDMNIEWRDIVHLFEALGGTVEFTRHGQLKVRLASHEQSFGAPHREHNVTSRDTLTRIRHFLEMAGFAPPPG